MRSFNGLPFKSYIGAPVTAAISLCGGAVVPLMLDWSLYGVSSAVPNLIVNVNLQSTQPGAVDPNFAIRSVYIDNMASSVPIYVTFPDTNYTVTAPPASAQWYLAFTNGRLVNIIGEGFTTNNLPKTLVLLSSVYVAPALETEINQSLALWLASASITRGNTIYNTNLGTPALGDQTINYVDTFSAPFTVVRDNLWGSPYPSGFIYLTHINVDITAGAASHCTWQIRNGASGLPLYSFDATVSAANALVKVLNFNAMNIKLDATVDWQIFAQTSGPAPTYLHTFNWTTNPQ